MPKQMLPEFASRSVQEICDWLKSNPGLATSVFESFGTLQIIAVLDKLGRLTDAQLAPALLSLLENPDPKVRSLAMKNLGKMSLPEIVPKIFEIARKDVSTLVRREATSSLGRMRSEAAKTPLMKLAMDSDPKIVLQAIRGLRPHLKNLAVAKVIRKLVDHPNETVSEYAKSLLSSQQGQVGPQKSSTKPIEIDSLADLAIRGDSLEVMARLPGESVDLTFTSPPYYNARDYSTYQSYSEYLQFLAKLFRGVHRLTKEGRFLVVNTSPVIVPRVSRAHSSTRFGIPYDLHAILVKEGWEFIDDIVWMKPEASVKNRIGGFMQHRKPLGYKPNAVTEMVMVYRKKTSKLIDWNMKQYSTETVQASKINGEYESTNVWKIDPAWSKGHSAVFPIALCDRVIEYYSYKGDLVFDPFGGSGTLGASALKNHRRFLLAEIDSSYFEVLKAKVRKAAMDFGSVSVPRFIELDKLKTELENFGNAIRQGAN
jgi:DNA modification methylase